MALVFAQLVTFHGSRLSKGTFKVMSFQLFEAPVSPGKDGSKAVLDYKYMVPLHFPFSLPKAGNPFFLFLPPHYPFPYAAALPAMTRVF